VDRSKAVTSARLAGADAMTARVALTASLPIAGLPMGKDQKPVPWTRGGTNACKGTLTLQFDGRLAGSSLVTSWSLEGEAQVGGQTITVVSKSDAVIDVRPGGTMPEMPKPVTVTPPAGETPK